MLTVSKAPKLFISARATRSLSPAALASRGRAAPSRDGAGPGATKTPGRRLGMEAGQRRREPGAPALPACTAGPRSAPGVSVVAGLVPRGVWGTI